MIGIDQAFRHHLPIHLAHGGLALDRIEVMQRIGAAFPLEPEVAGALGVEVLLDLESHPARELLRILPHDQVVVGVVHHLLGHQRGGAHAFDARHGARPFARTVHARRIQLHHPFGVGQAAVADARVFGIEFDDIDAGDEGVEDVLALGHHRKRALHAGLGAAVLVFMAIGRRNDDRADAATRDGRRAGGLSFCGGGKPGGRAGEDEFASVHRSLHM
jgi:hypothetical protein